MSLTTDRGSRPNMQGRVIAEMRRRIISGELAPGVSLSEVALAESFGVSRTPVREALKQLQTEGLVEIRKGRFSAPGSIVASGPNRFWITDRMFTPNGGRLNRLVLR